MSNLFSFSLLRTSKIDEGVYSYRLANVEAQHDTLTNYGMRDRLVFTFELAMDDRQEQLVQRFTVSQSPASRYMRFMQMLCNAYRTTKLDLRELIGSTGMLTIAHSQDEKGNVFENVVSMQPSTKETEEAEDMEHGI